MHRLALIVIAVAGCVITRPPRPTERPRWYLDTEEARVEAGCALGRAFLRKSGKTGFGLAVQWRSTGDCRIAIARARLAFARGPTIAIALPEAPPYTLPGRSLVYAWLPIAFDNNAAWNAGRDRATLELELDTGGGAVATVWRIPVVQR